MRRAEERYEKTPNIKYRSKNWGRNPALKKSDPQKNTARGRQRLTVTPSHRCDC